MKSKANILIIALVIIIIIVGAIIIFGGSESPTPPPAENGGEPNEEEPSEPGSQVISGIGTVYYMDLEGGFFGIVGDDGRQYQPINLAANLQEDGLRLSFTGEIVEDFVDMYMWGIPLVIEEASVIAEPGEIEEPEHEEEMPAEEMPAEEMVE